MSEQERKEIKAINAASAVIWVFWYNTAKFEAVVFLCFFHNTSQNDHLLDEWAVSWRPFTAFQDAFMTDELVHYTKQCFWLHFLHYQQISGSAFFSFERNWYNLCFKIRYQSLECLHVFHSVTILSFQSSDFAHPIYRDKLSMNVKLNKNVWLHYF